jgi:hypothetical protein
VSNSSNNVIWPGQRTHIVKEGLKAFAPSATDAYSFRAVVLKVRALFVIATRLHVCPDSVNSRAFQPMCAIANFIHFISQAIAAAIRTLSNQATRPNFNLSPTIALAQPIADSGTAWCLSENEESSRANTGQIMEFHS